MSIFDVRFFPCDEVREMVITDQTQHECACEHGCAFADRACPLSDCFSETSGVTEVSVAELVPHVRYT